MTILSLSSLWLWRVLVENKQICLEDNSLRPRVESHEGRVNIKECLEAMAIKRDTKTIAVFDHLLFTAYGIYRAALQ